ncbi:PLP-dependent transferase [Tilletiaria anomala UBC 951]|uniref:PLP-dependent transferase n=1 Tax=Tilletiaria anomala (strain ATCC 24038 / CBS 436.72 / UBC 951) TaxID=1037660 RepID=A0A066WGJ2_TILAU|nr:PLP-dependent transferase [Tilletiaria anomala UBC 951]KDN52886.1 PLP-dependent transferase [Tilletiaria anomala UBC 951]
MVTGANGLPQLSSGPGGTASFEIDTLLRPALERVLEWIRKGEREDAPVLRWPTSKEARDNIIIPSISSLGSHVLLEEESKHAKRPQSSHTLSEQGLLELIGTVLDNSINPWTGRFLDKLYAAPKPIGLVADLILSVLNANCHVFSSSPVLSLVEEMCVQELGRLCGWSEAGSGSNEESQVDGLTMPGGSASNTLAIQTALATMFPSYKEAGILGALDDINRLKALPPPGSADASVGRHVTGQSEVETVSSASLLKPLIFTSDQSHYSIQKAALACGLGLESVIKVPCDPSGRMDPEALDRMLHNLRPSHKGFPFFVNATAGTTVLGSFDNLEAISEICKQNNLWLHVDGSWGGPVLFSSRWKHLISGIDSCHSFTINPHKLLNVPLQCSFLIFKHGKQALKGNSLAASYLFHSADMRDNPGMKTLGCGRKGDALKLYLTWLRYGKEGLGAHVDRGFELAAKAIAMVKAAAPRLVLYPPPESSFLQVCFRPYKEGLSTEQLSQAVIEVRERLQSERMFAVDFAPLPGQSGQFLRLVTHPSTKESDLQTLIQRVAALGEKYFADS